MQRVRSNSRSKFRVSSTVKCTRCTFDHVVGQIKNHFFMSYVLIRFIYLVPHFYDEFVNIRKVMCNIKTTVRHICFCFFFIFYEVMLLTI